jgi:hypothetical protein
VNDGLLAPNPAAHLVWWVASAAFAAVAIFVLLDALRTLRYWWSSRRLPLEPGESAADGFHLEPNATALRRRFRRPLAGSVPWRTWREGRVNEPPAGGGRAGRRLDG